MYLNYSDFIKLKSIEKIVTKEEFHGSDDLVIESDLSEKTGSGSSRKNPVLDPQR